MLRRPPNHFWPNSIHPSIRTIHCPCYFDHNNTLIDTFILEDIHPSNGTILCAERWCCLSSLLGYWAQSWTGHHSQHRILEWLNRPSKLVLILLTSEG